MNQPMYPNGYPAPTAPQGYPAPMAPQGGGFDPMAALYNDIAGAQVNQRGLYLEPGFYEVRIEKAFFLSTQSGNQFIVESSMRKAAPTDPSQATKYPPGVKVSWTCNLTKHASAKGNVKGFIAAMLGIPAGDKGRIDSEITPAVISQATAPGANPFGGLIVTVQVQQVPTKPKAVQTSQGLVMQAGVYSLHTWGSPAGRDPEWRADGSAPMMPQAAPQAPQGFGAAPAPMAPPPPLPQAPAPAFPPAGWVAHPSTPGAFWHPATNAVKWEADLRAAGG